MARLRTCVFVFVAAALVGLASVPASAQTAPVTPPLPGAQGAAAQPAEIQRVREELDRLRVEFDTLRRAYDERLLLLEQRLTQIGGGPLVVPAVPATTPAAPLAPPAIDVTPPPGTVAAGEQTPAPAAPATSSKVFNPDISVNGNFVGAAGSNPFATFPALQLNEVEAAFRAIVDPVRARGFLFRRRTGGRRSRGGVHHVHVAAGGPAAQGRQAASPVRQDEHAAHSCVAHRGLVAGDRQPARWGRGHL